MCSNFVSLWCRGCPTSSVTVSVTHMSTRGKACRVQHDASSHVPFRNRFDADMGAVTELLINIHLAILGAQLHGNSPSNGRAAILVCDSELRKVNVGNDFSLHSTQTAAGWRSLLL